MPFAPPTTFADRPQVSFGGLDCMEARFGEILASSLVLAEDWDELHATKKNAIAACRDEDELLRKLVDFNLLNGYQASRLRAGKEFGLALGNYRVLDRIGAGGMGVIYLAEHTQLRKKVAIKTLTWNDEGDKRLLTRFNAEMRAVGQLRHQNIVSAIDVGHVASPHPDVPSLHYFVMEYLPGQDLEALVHDKGPLAPVQACQIGRQVADALHEAHRRGLIHRDIKPSNVLVTPEGSAKLLDFGLARTARTRLTEPGSVLGTLGYMAPEQAQDATTVDERADIYSLGATLFWALTGRDPFPVTNNVAQDLNQRLTKPAPSARAMRADVPVKLDEVVTKMMAVAPADRYPTAEAVMRALLPFAEERRRGESVVLSKVAGVRLPSGKLVTPPAYHRVLVVDDESGIRTFCSLALRGDGAQCEEAADGIKALEILAARPFDLVLLDIDMPNLSGTETLKRIRESAFMPNLKVVMFSGRSTADDMAHLLISAGADDFLPKPFTLVQLRARVKAALRLKDAQDRSDLLNRHLLAVNADLEQSLTAKDGALFSARNALVLSLARLVEARSAENGAHVPRLQRYCRALGDEALAGRDFGLAVDEAFVQTLEACSPLHDIGKVALPDTILNNPGNLGPEERLQMQTHTIVGAETLREVAKSQGFTAGFLQMAVDIARSHHERYDGTGYPDRLAGGDIPLSARFVAVADVYDALRSRRVYKPALPHSSAIMTILEGSPGQFDPKVLTVFRRCLPQFDRIFRECLE